MTRRWFLKALALLVGGALAPAKIALAVLQPKSSKCPFCNNRPRERVRHRQGYLQGYGTGDMQSFPTSSLEGRPRYNWRENQGPVETHTYCDGNGGKCLAAKIHEKVNCDHKIIVS